MNKPQTQSATRPARHGLCAQTACDALILLGASCQGADNYAEIAAELGYGRLRMPAPCDSESIRAQLDHCLQRQALH